MWVFLIIGVNGMNQFNCILQIENQDMEFIVCFERYKAEPGVGFFQDSIDVYELRTPDGHDADFLLTDDNICDVIIEQIKDYKENEY